VDELAQVAKDRGVDWWSSANRGLNSLAGRLLGSVPTNISHRATCDVLIAHTTGRFRK
jgi:nucleotide-binding universal stress UspA family protein